MPRVSLGCNPTTRTFSARHCSAVLAFLVVAGPACAGDDPNNTVPPISTPDGGTGHGRRLHAGEVA